VITAVSLLLPLAQSHGGFVREPGQGSTTCVGKNTSICLSWAIDHIGDYVTPTLEHLGVVLASVAIGFAIAFALVLVSHRRRWLIPTFTGITGVIYTIPSIALFLLLLPITGRGNVTAVVALSLYTLQIIYRNTVAGLANVPAAAKDAGRGMGMTENQLLWRVELPLAVPEIIAGVRIATVSTVAIASLAVFAGGGGLGGPLYFAIQQGLFKTGIFIPTVILLAMAVLLDVVLMLVQSRLSRWRSPQAPGRRAGGRFWRRISGAPQADPA
jgi:osmoprotectant transport system permease protein